MMLRNSYPNLPEIPYKRTSVEMPLVVLFAKSLIGKYKKEHIAMAYAIFRNESANGRLGVNNNYGGIQADCGVWTGLPGNPVATCVKIDSGNANRRFLCFGEDGYKISFELFCIKARDRKMVTASDYFKSWVGKKNPTAQDTKNFTSLLNAGLKILA